MPRVRGIHLNKHITDHIRDCRHAQRKTKIILYPYKIDRTRTRNPPTNGWGDGYMATGRTLQPTLTRATHDPTSSPRLAFMMGSRAHDNVEMNHTKLTKLTD